VVPDENVLCQAVCAGMSRSAATQCEWRRTIAINKQEIDGDMLKHIEANPSTHKRRPNDGVLVFLHPDKDSACELHPLKPDLGLITAHMKDMTGSIKSLVRIVKKERVIAFPNMHCTLLKGWHSYAELAQDTSSHMPAIVPVTRIMHSSVVCFCNRPALQPSKRKFGSGPWLSVRPFR